MTRRPPHTISAPQSLATRKWSRRTDVIVPSYSTPYNSCNPIESVHYVAEDPESVLAMEQLASLAPIGSLSRSPPTKIHSLQKGRFLPPFSFSTASETKLPACMATPLLLLKLSAATLLAALACIWIARPTQHWKRSWHVAEDKAGGTILGDNGLVVLVYCFPLLAVAALVYICLYMTAQKEQRRGRRRQWMTKLTNPLIIMSNPVGIVSAAELLSAALFITFLAWTYYSYISSDFKKMTPNKSLHLNRWQLKTMRLGVRIGSMSEACLILLFLPILRGMAVFRILGIQFEASVKYHIWIGNVMILLSLLHGFTIMFIWTVKRSLLKEIIKWQSIGRVNIAGAIALATGVIIWITSLPQIRRKQFQLFFLVHHLYIVFVFFFLMHVGDKHFYLVLAGVLLFVVDKILRIIQSRKTTLVASASILPCRAVKLTLPKHACMSYTPTSMIFIKVPTISKFQWHPFSITSSSNMDSYELSILVKCHGNWTTGLYNMVASAVEGGSDHLNNIPVAVEGPYGPATVEYRRYKSLVLIAGGSGISPFLSIIEDIASRNDGMDRKPTKVQLIYAVKKVQDLSMLALISPLLLNQSAELGNLKLKIFVTQEDVPPVTVDKLLQDLSMVKTITFSKASPKDAVPVAEGLLWQAMITAFCFVVFLASLILLSLIFLHKGKKSSNENNPSWVGDLFVLCSITIAASCCTVATVLSRWRRRRPKSGSQQPCPHKKETCAEMPSAKVQAEVVEKHEISFGSRPNLAEILSGFDMSAEDSEVGVFVCGPISMQESIASFCTRSTKDEGKSKGSFSFHFINFYL